MQSMKFRAKNAALVLGMFALLSAGLANAQAVPARVYSYVIGGVRMYSAKPPTDPRAEDIKTFNVSGAPAKTTYGWGIGNNSCGKFNMDTAKLAPDDGLEYGGNSYVSGSYGYFQWLAGFLTGASTYGSPNPRTDLFGAYGAVAKYCADRPTDSVLMAAYAFLRDEQARQGP